MKKIKQYIKKDWEKTNFVRYWVPIVIGWFLFLMVDSIKLGTIEKNHVWFIVMIWQFCCLFYYILWQIDMHMQRKMKQMWRNAYFELIELLKEVKKEHENLHSGDDAPE